MRVLPDLDGHGIAACVAYHDIYARIICIFMFVGKDII